MQVIYPASIQAAARELGVTLPANETVEAVQAVVEMAEELSPGADFGALKFKAIGHALVTAVKKPVTTAASKMKGSGIVGGSTVAFGIRSTKITPKAAMAAADRLLGDTKIANAQAVIRNTHALAALGDPAARRGLVILQAVGNIRAAKSAQPGQHVIPIVKTQSLRAVTIKRTPAQVRRMATKTPVTAKTPSLWKRVLTWIKG